MAEGLKVLMMGGQRVGKSSALAAVMDSFVNGCGKDLFSVQDVTTLTQVDGVKQASISSKLAEVKEMLQQNVGKTIIVNSGKTNIKWDYKLELTLAGSNDSMTMTFTDVNGEYFEGGNMQQDSIIELVKEYDVFIVAVDTPFLMEARNEDNELVDRIINNKYNCIDSIHTFLTNIDDSNGENAKLVIFVPIKCEYWARKGDLDLVSAAIQEDYATSLKALGKYKSVHIEILPIQTVGSAVFAEHLEAYIFEWTKRQFLLFKKKMRSRCGVLQNGKIRLNDGSIKEASSGKVHEDMEAVLISGSDIIRPNSWFKIESSEYRPHNCEQLAYHILEFMLAKVVDARIREDERQNGFVKGLKKFANFFLNVGTFGLWEKIKDLFGSISIEKMQDTLKKLQDRDMIKHSGEGISIIKNCAFKS